MKADAPSAAAHGRARTRGRAHGPASPDASGAPEPLAAARLGTARLVAAGLAAGRRAVARLAAARLVAAGLAVGRLAVARSAAARLVAASLTVGRWAVARSAAARLVAAGLAAGRWAVARLNAARLIAAGLTVGRRAAARLAAARPAAAGLAVGRRAVARSAAARLIAAGLAVGRWAAARLAAARLVAASLTVGRWAVARSAAARLVAAGLAAGRWAVARLNAARLAAAGLTVGRRAVARLAAARLIAAGLAVGRRAVARSAAARLIAAGLAAGRWAVARLATARLIAAGLAVGRLAVARLAAARLAAAGLAVGRLAVARLAAGRLAAASLAAGRLAVARRAAAKHFLPAAVFVLCLAAYVSNGDFLPGSDQQGNMLFSINLLKRHSLSIGPLDAPYSFSWTLEQPGEPPLRVTVDRWNSSADEAYRDGRLQAREHHFYLAETTRHQVFVNTFGLGAALFGLPVYALLDLFVDIENDRFWWWHGGALTASLLTAAAALFVFLSARGFVRPLPAVLVALAFGLGSCAWPISSQALWQHPASTFCLSLGAWFLLRSAKRRHAAAWCGAAFGMAVLCRPVTAVAVVCVGAYLLWTDRRRCAAFVLGGLPFLAILAAYNGYYFGNPLVFGQTVVSKIVALRATGSEHLWQSSWIESLPGLLVSPARGLLWFSPVLALGLASAAAVWREPRYRPLLPLLAAVVLMILVAGKWFDWWGGTTWGYRTIVDTTPFLALLLIPIIERMISARGTRVMFAALLLWSIGVQFVGAYSYNLIGWIDHWRRQDNPDYASLWQWQRPQIGFHLDNFGQQRALKRQLVAAHANSPTPVLILRDKPRQAAANGVPRLGPSQRDPAAMQNHADTLLEQGRYEEAIDAFRAILEIDPESPPAYAGVGDALFRMRRYEDALAALARALSLQPDLPVAGSVHRLMGRCEQELGRPDDALPHYQRALEIDSADARAIELLARLQFVRERYLESFDLFRTLVEIDPANAQNHANLGATLYHLGRVEDAIGSFEHALSLDPTLETVRTTLDQLRGSAR